MADQLNNDFGHDSPAHLAKALTIALRL